MKQETEWWEHPTASKYEKWVAYFLVPVLILISCFGIWLIVNTRTDLIERDERRIEKAEQRNTALIEDLHEIQNRLDQGSRDPAREEAFRSIGQIERMIEELLEKHEPNGSQSSDS